MLWYTCKINKGRERFKVKEIKKENLKKLENLSHKETYGVLSNNWYLVEEIKEEIFSMDYDYYMDEFNYMKGFKIIDIEYGNGISDITIEIISLEDTVNELEDFLIMDLDLDLKSNFDIIQTIKNTIISLLNHPYDVSLKDIMLDYDDLIENYLEYQELYFDKETYDIYNEYELEQRNIDLDEIYELNND